MADQNGGRKLLQAFTWFSATFAHTHTTHTHTHTHMYSLITRIERYRRYCLRSLRGVLNSAKFAYEPRKKRCQKDTHPADGTSAEPINNLSTTHTHTHTHTRTHTQTQSVRPCLRYSNSVDYHRAGWCFLFVCFSFCWWIAAIDIQGAPRPPPLPPPTASMDSESCLLLLLLLLRLLLLLLLRLSSSFRF